MLFLYKRSIRLKLVNELVTFCFQDHTKNNDTCFWQVVELFNCKTESMFIVTVFQEVIPFIREVFYFVANDIQNERAGCQLLVGNESDIRYEIYSSTNISKIVQITILSKVESLISY
jgi:hypothetical protein